MIAEAIFNSKIKYGIAVYLSPIFDEEELKVKKIPKDTSVLQTLQNSMIRVILGMNRKQHINMENLRPDDVCESNVQLSHYIRSQQCH